MASMPDPLRIDIPVRTPVRPTAPIDTPTRTFRLESRGGYARSVTGKVAYLDVEANTYMVMTEDRTLTRVPLRDIHDRGSLIGASR
jgi:hypothetical protein